MIELSSSQEEYLKAIYILSKTNNSLVRVTDIANYLSYSKPSVNRAIKNLKEIGMVNYETYGDVSLTEEGINYSKGILRKFDVVKILLKEIIGLSEEEASKEAANIKSVISQDTQNKIEKYVENELGLTNLNCGYNMENEKCRSCARVTKGKGGEKSNAWT